MENCIKKVVTIKLFHIGEDYGTIGVGKDRKDVSLGVVEMIFGREVIE
jgi:hypothetical protein